MFLTEVMHEVLGVRLIISCNLFIYSWLTRMNSLLVAWNHQLFFYLLLNIVLWMCPILFNLASNHSYHVESMQTESTFLSGLSFCLLFHYLCELFLHNLVLLCLIL